MATEINQKVPIELQDGQEVILCSLPIARLRKFMAAWREMEDVEVEEDTFDVFINCAGIAIGPQLKGREELADRFELTDGSGKKKAHLDPKFKEYMEEVVDVNTALEIMKVCGGIDLKDPKLIQMTAEAAMAAGTTSTS